jgi:hypothetical protein
LVAFFAFFFGAAFLVAFFFAFRLVAFFGAGAATGIIDIMSAILESPV